MSNELLGACAHLQMPPSAKAVLMSLADQANADGVSWPSVGSLAEYTCLSERTVQRSLRELQDAGFVTWRMRRDNSNVYLLNKWSLLKLKAAFDALREAARAAEAADKSRGDMVSPQGCHGDARGDTVSPQGCHGVTQTIIEPNTGNTPHTPLPSAGGLAGDAAQAAGTAEQPSRPKRARREGKPMLGMAAWLKQVDDAGEKAIPADDPVYGYAAKVGIGEDLLLLCWREFKRRQLAGSKRQKDWRQAFRNCVQGSWYRLWFLKGGEGAQLTSVGEQVKRFFEAEDEAASGQEGGNA